MDRLPQVDRANRLLTDLWRRGVLTEPRMDANVLEAAALAGRPRSTLGTDDTWREPFERLAVALRDEAELNPLGRAIAHSQIVALLRQRMTAQQLWRKRPQVLDRPLAPPIIVLGQMRSGTTRMQRLLACDPRFTYTRTSESLTPVPRSFRWLRAAASLAALRLFNPETLRIHPSHASAPEEEFGWLAFGFGPAHFEAQWRIPSFARWWEQDDTRGVYREFAALMRSNAARRRDDVSKPWILKMPQYLQDLAVVLDTFPGARIVRVERDQESIVASSASLVWHQMRIQSDRADRHWIGAEWLRKTQLRHETAEAVLARRPDVPVIRVGYQAMSDDWQSEMTRIYNFLGLSFGDSVRRSMQRFIDESRQHRGHRYDPADFGLLSSNLAANAA